MRKNCNLPNFFIVGAAKAGTSSLWQYLKNHPDIFMPEDETQKEPRFFSHLEKYDSIENYLAIFNKALNKTKRIGEASTAYLTCPDSAQRIYDYSKRFNLDTKILIILRNPADRAYSLYNWMVQDGYEYSNSFENALSKEKRRRTRLHSFWDPEYYYNYQYYSSGLYSQQVARYLSIFGEENVHVEIFEEFLKDVSGSMVKILNFLQVNPELELIQRIAFNPSFQVRAPWIQFFLRKLTTFLIRFKFLRLSNKFERDRLMVLGMTKKKTLKMNPALQSSLLSEYRPDIIKLEELLKRDLKIWFRKQVLT